MKQGSSSYNVTDKKREPRTTLMSPAGVSQIGEAIGNKSDYKTSDYRGDRVRMGPGFTAPMDEGRTIHKGGSQGRR